MAIKRKLLEIFNPESQGLTALIEYCLKTFLIGTGCAIILSIISNISLRLVGFADKSIISDTYTNLNFINFLGVVVFAPVVETWLMALLIRKLCCFTKNKLIVCCITAAVAGVLHGLKGVYYFVGPTFLFFIFSHSYLLWRRHSYLYAYISACVPHAMNNFIVFLMLVVLQNLQ